MNNKYRISFAVVILYVVIIFAGCAPESTYLVNLTLAKNAVINYQENGGFHKDTEEAVNKAIKEFDNITPGEKSAVVFDKQYVYCFCLPLNHRIAPVRDGTVCSTHSGAVSDALRVAGSRRFQSLSLPNLFSSR